MSSQIYPAGDHQETTHLGLGLWGMDEVTADNFILIDNAFSSLSPLEVNGTPVPSPVNLVNSASVTISVVGSSVSFTASGSGSSAFSSLTSGTNTTASMLVGSGSTLVPSGTGSINASGAWLSPSGTSAPSPLWDGTAISIQSIAAASGSPLVTVYTISNTPQYASNGAQGAAFVVAGCSNPANNSSIYGYLCSASTATTLTLDNANGVLQASAAGTVTLYEAFTGTGIIPTMYVQDVNGYWHGQMAVDTLTTNPYSTGPTGPQGTLTIGRRTFFRDYDPSLHGGKNAFISVGHMSGRGTAVSGNQDRAMWVSMLNDQGSSDPIYGMECIQAEMDILGAPAIAGAVDGEISALSLQVSDQHTNNIGSPNFGVNCMRATFFREIGAGNWGSIGPSVIRAQFYNNSSVNGGGMVCSGVFAQCTDINNNSSNLYSAAVIAAAPLIRFAGGNYGVEIGNFGSNASDFALYVNGGQSILLGPVGIQSVYATAGNLPVTGSVSASSLTLSQLVAPAPGNVTVVGITGSTTYSYVVVARDSNGNGVASTTFSTTTGNATLSGSNFNFIELVTPALGPTAFDIYRTVGGATQGKIATLPASAANYIENQSLILSDTGLVADGTTPPSANTTGSLVVPGPVYLGAAAGSPSSAATAGTAGEIVYYSGLLYFCSVTGVAGSATWNKLSMTAV